MKLKLLPLLGALTLVATSQSVFASDSEQGGDRKGPPPEAITACEGKSAGDSAEFAGRNDETITGTCEDHNGTLILRPDNPPERN